MNRSQLLYRWRFPGVMSFSATLPFAGKRVSPGTADGGCTCSVSGIAPEQCSAQQLAGERFSPVSTADSPGPDHLVFSSGSYFS